MRYLAFDIETAKVIPGESFDLMSYRPLGIACAATLCSDSRDLRVWHGSVGDKPASTMTRDDLKKLIDYLCAMAASGYQILTWNGLAFDFDILAEEATDVRRCAEIAKNHIDMMFHAVCCLGHRIGIDKTAQGMGLPGKPTGMTGAKAPQMWAEGRHREVLDYVSRDVEMAVAIAEAGARHRSLTWITQRGTPRSMPLTTGWLTVEEAFGLPEPDTSWMSDPPCRDDFMLWMRSAC